MKMLTLKISSLLILLGLQACSDDARRDFSSSGTGKDLRANKIQLLEAYLANGDAKKNRDGKVEAILCKDEVVANAESTKKDSTQSCQPISCVVEEIVNEQNFVEAVKSESTESRAGFDLNKEEGKYREKYQIVTKDLDLDKVWICTGADIIDDKITACAAPSYSPPMDQYEPKVIDAPANLPEGAQESLKKDDLVIHYPAPITCDEPGTTEPVSDTVVCDHAIPAIYIDDKNTLSCSATAVYKKGGKELTETLEVKIEGGADKLSFEAQLAARACKLGSEQKIQDFLDTIKCQSAR